MGGNKRVEHHIVTAFQWRSLHIDEEGELGEEERLMEAETDKCISEAHSSLTRRFSPAVMAAECLNTYSLAALLSKISHYAAVACSYLTALNRVRSRFFPFTVEDGLVTVGFVSLTLEQSLTLAVDFSAGFSAAPSSVKVSFCFVCQFFLHIILLYLLLRWLSHWEDMCRPAPLPRWLRLWHLALCISVSWLTRWRNGSR